jgi:hypothetical protein
VIGDWWAGDTGSSKLPAEDRPYLWHLDKVVA